MATFLTQGAPNPEDELKKLGAPAPAGGGETPGVNPFGALAGGATATGNAGAAGASGGAPASPGGAFAQLGQPAAGQPAGQAPQSLNAAPQAMKPAAGGPAPAQAAPGAPQEMQQAPAAAAPLPAGQLDPNQVAGDLKGEFKTKFNRDISEAEIAGLQKNAGWSPGQPVTPEIKARFSQLIQAYTGDPNNPGAIPPAGGAAAPPGAPQERTGRDAQSVLQDLLTKGTTGALGNVDMNNPAILAQKNAFNRANGAATTKERLAAAERSAARGTHGSGGFDAELSAIERGAGDRATGFESQMMKGELDNQRQQVMQALTLATQSGDAAQARALQEKLGNLDAQLRTRGMDDQKMLGKGQLSLGLLQSLMGDQRAKDALGFNYASLGQQGKQFDLNAILNGLG